MSLFDGISCGRMALERAGVRIDEYHASEIDKNAIMVSEHWYKDIVRYGDVRTINAENLPKIDLLIGGSPCQSFSKAGKRDGFDGKSGLFFEFVRLLEQTRPSYFLLENVKMKNEWRDIISEHLGVEPILLNSNLYSAQNRSRYYWTNIPLDPPVDQKIYLDSVVLDDALPICLTEARTEEAKAIRKQYRAMGKDYCPRRGKELVERTDGKSNCLTATFSNKEHLVKLKEGGTRKLLPIEWERLQTLPDGYTDVCGLGDTARYKLIGNGWTVDALAHLFKNIS